MAVFFEDSIVIKPCLWTTLRLRDQEYYFICRSLLPIVYCLLLKDDLKLIHPIRLYRDPSLNRLYDLRLFVLDKKHPGVPYAIFIIVV